MNNFSEPFNKELAERLCNDKASHEKNLSGDWLETEYRAHPKVAEVQNEVDLQMRGLGPLTKSDMVESSTRTPSARSHVSSTGTILVVAAVCMGVTTFYSIIRRFSA